MKQKYTIHSSSADLASACRKAALAYRNGGISAHFLRLHCHGGRTLLVTFEPQVELSLCGVVRLAGSVNAERAVYVGEAQGNHLVIATDLPTGACLAVDVRSLGLVDCPNDPTISKVSDALRAVIKARAKSLASVDTSRTR